MNSKRHPSVCWQWMPVLLFGLAVGTAIPFRTTIPISWDNIQFTLALDNYNILLHQPHPPGYFLFVMLGRLLAPLFSDPYQALVAEAVVAGALAVAVTYCVGAVIFDRWAGLIAAVVLLTSPISWSARSSGLTYSFDALFAVLLALCAWQTRMQRSFPWWPGALILAVAAGFRQTDALFLMPLWLWSLQGRSWRVYIAHVQCHWRLRGLQACQ